MARYLECPQCKTRHVFTPELAGKKFTCSTCQQAYIVPRSAVAKVVKTEPKKRRSAGKKILIAVMAAFVICPSAFWLMLDLKDVHTARAEKIQREKNAQEFQKSGEQFQTTIL